MGCQSNIKCGGCALRHLDINDYQTYKQEKIKALFSFDDAVWQKPVFIGDGTRRRAAFAFCFKKGHLSFGFNENKSNIISEISNCLMLTKKINQELSGLKCLLEKLCQIEIYQKTKAKKKEKTYINNGDLLVLEADNGLDIVLETEQNLELNHRYEIADFVEKSKNIIRFSCRTKHAFEAEPVVQKTQPFINIAGVQVFIAAGDFLQASKEGETALINLVLSYIGNTQGKMADLFCGAGTFSYAMRGLKNTHIIAADFSKTLLKSFKQTLDRNMITNIDIKEKNLFLYPMEASELKNFDVVVFDPPRAGAFKQVQEFCKIAPNERPKKIIAVSCNPQTFAKDASLLIEAGYRLNKITLVDQFVYSEHAELVALFES